jgi:hypothetical protein
LAVWIYCTLYMHSSGLEAIQRYLYSSHLFVVTCALGFSVFTSRILATESHCNFKPHMKPSSFHSPISFLPLFCNCQSWRLDSIPLLPSSYPGRLASPNSTLHSVVPNWIFIYTQFVRTTRKTSPSIVPYCFRHTNDRGADHIQNKPLYCWGVFTESLPSNGYTRHNRLLYL